MTPAELTAARESLHLSQVELSHVLGVHPNIVNRWEHSRAKIPPYLHLALAGITRSSTCSREDCFRMPKGHASMCGYHLGHARAALPTQHPDRDSNFP